MKADKDTSVASAFVQASMARGLKGDAWRTMAAWEWAKRKEFLLSTPPKIEMVEA
jgi:hypothetical protein